MSNILIELGLQKGANPMTVGQFRRRIQARLNLDWPPLKQLDDPQGYQAYFLEMMPHVKDAEEAFRFNRELAAYRRAVARLARYRIAEGQPEVTETTTDPETGEEVTTVMQAAIEPLPTTIERETYDPETGDVTGTEDVPNPAILQDDAERAEAQAIVDAASEEVKGWDTQTE